MIILLRFFFMHVLSVFISRISNSSIHPKLVISYVYIRRIIFLRGSQIRLISIFVFFHFVGSSIVCILFLLLPVFRFLTAVYSLGTLQHSQCWGPSMGDVTPLKHNFINKNPAKLLIFCWRASNWYQTMFCNFCFACCYHFSAFEGTWESCCRRIGMALRW